jgi:NitT/TauT family transport system substrate-binding protein
MDCAWVQGNKQTVQKLANAFVRTLKYINTHSAQEIAAKMPADYAGSDPKLYVKAINDTKSIFTQDGLMSADGAKNVLEVLGSFSPNVQGKKATIDLSKTYTTEFATAAKTG